MKNKVLVAGAGISGIHACGLLSAQGRKVILYDGIAQKDVQELRSGFPEDGCPEIILGELPEEVLPAAPERVTVHR